MIDMREGDCWSFGRELGWNVPFDLTRGLFDNTGSVSIHVWGNFIFM